MIDLWLVVSNSLWIAGLSLILATLSWASWAASQDGTGSVRLSTTLTRPSVRRAWELGAALFCAGMAATGRAWWEWALWGVLALGFLVHALGLRAMTETEKKGRAS